jgi:hypothetical protein
LLAIIERSREAVLLGQQELDLPLTRIGLSRCRVGPVAELRDEWMLLHPERQALRACLRNPSSAQPVQPSHAPVCNRSGPAGLVETERNGDAKRFHRFRIEPEHAERLVQRRSPTHVQAKEQLLRLRWDEWLRGRWRILVDGIEGHRDVLASWPARSLGPVACTCTVGCLRSTPARSSSPQHED